jgi:site-specific recombinase XerD
MPNWRAGNGPKQKLPQRLTREEAAALIAQPNRRYPTGIRNRALLRLFYRSGLRCFEALNLRVRDVDLARGEIRVWRGNGERDRRVWIDDTTVKTHITHILQKLDLRDRVQAVVLAYETGLFEA